MPTRPVGSWRLLGELGDTGMPKLLWYEAGQGGYLVWDIQADLSVAHSEWREEVLGWPVAMIDLDRDGANELLLRDEDGTLSSAMPGNLEPRLQLAQEDLPSWVGWYLHSNGRTKTMGNWWYLGNADLNADGRDSSCFYNPDYEQFLELTHEVDGQPSFFHARQISSELDIEFFQLQPIEPNTVQTPALPLGP